MNRYDFVHCIKNLSALKDLNLSFSQEGEDMVIDELLKGKKEGFYVDLGAHHPIHLSNTYKFYIRGWKGVNVDAMPGSMELFKRYRSRDINVEAGVSDVSGEMIFYEFDEPAVNTFNKEDAIKSEQKGYRMIKQEPIAIYSVMELFDKYIPKNQSIDVLDVDIEGFDDRIIEAIDWNKYRPTIVLVEKDEENRNLAFYENKALSDVGYKMIASTYRTGIWKREL